MGADCTAAWLGVLIVSALSFAPGNMSPDPRVREVAARVARLSLPASFAAALWITLSAFSLTPPPGGVLLWALYPALLLQLALASYGAALLVCRLLEWLIGHRLPQLISIVMGLGAALFVVAAR